MNKQTEVQIEKIYKAVFKKIFTQQNVKQAMQGNTIILSNNVEKLMQSDSYKSFCEEFAKKLAKAGLNKQKGIWKKYFEAAKKLHHIALPNTYKEFEKQMLVKAIKHNFKMIKSVPQHVLKVYQQKDIEVLVKQVAENKLGRKAFYNQLKEHGYKNAKVIARTESAKLQTSIDRNSATDLGSVCYTWRSSNDKRTRPSHKEMNDVIVFWRNDENKPLRDNMRGDAGEFPNCRCNPTSIFDENDLKKSNYKVYDYRIDKIITMPKTKLLEAIKRGGLEENG